MQALVSPQLSSVSTTCVEKEPPPVANATAMWAWLVPAAAAVAGPNITRSAFPSPLTSTTSGESFFVAKNDAGEQSAALALKSKRDADADPCDETADAGQQLDRAAWVRSTGGAQNEVRFAVARHVAECDDRVGDLPPAGGRGQPTCAGSSRHSDIRAVIGRVGICERGSDDDVIAAVAVDIAHQGRQGDVCRVPWESR